MPEARSLGKVDKAELGLFPVRAEVICGLIFVNLDPHATPLAELVGDLPAAARALRDRAPAALRARASPARTVNWKIVADNYLEGYHVPIAHPGLMRLLDYQNYTVEIHDDYAWFDAPLRDKPSGNRLERAYQRLVRPMPGLGEADRRVWHFVFIWPNTTIDLYPDQVLTWQIGARRRRPHARRRGELPAARRRPPRAAWSASSTSASTSSSPTRTSISCENVQAGLATRGYRCGPLSGREAGVAWFADRVRGALAS